MNVNGEHKKEDFGNRNWIRQQHGQHQTAFLVSLVTATAGGIYTGGAYLGSNDFLTLLLTLAVGLAVLAIRWESKLVWPIFLLAFWLLGSWRFIYADMLPPGNIADFVGSTVKIRATVAAEPHLTNNDDTDGKRIRYVAEVREILSPSTQTAANGRLFVFDQCTDEKQTAPARIGDEITAVGKIYYPQRYGNPGQPDTVNMLKSQGITAQMSSGKNGVQTIPQDKPKIKYRVLRYLSDIRAHYRQALETVMPASDAATVMGILFGGYGGVPLTVVEDFTRTGIVHILSVSGTHISLMAAFAVWLGSLCRFSRRRQTLLTVSIIVFYALLSGLEPPVIRAALMGILVFWALSLGRIQDGQRLLLIVVLCMLIASPLLLFHISFELSVMSTAGLLFLSPLIRKKLRGYGWPNFIADNVALTFGAVIFTVPLAAWYFNQVSLISLAANLIVVPWVDIIIILALFGGIIGFILPPLGSVLFATVALLWSVTAKLAHTLATVTGGVVHVASFGWSGSFIYYAVWFCIIADVDKLSVGHKYYNRYKLKLVPLALILLLLFGAGYKYRWGTTEISVHFIDVGQGDAALLITPHGQAVMFDTGGTRQNKFDVGLKVDRPYLRHYGINELTAIFLTHVHEDHAGGAGSLLRLIPVGRVFTAGEGNAAYEKTLALSENNPLSDKLTATKAGQKFIIDGVTIETIYAPTVTPNHAGNDASNVYRISYGKFSVLITGDVEKYGEAEMLAEGRVKPCTVLKMAHHGSATSNSVTFLQAAQPKAAVFCVGRDNSFGHPHPEVLERVQRFTAAVYRTDVDGAIVFASDGETVRTETFYGKSKRRF